MSKRIVVIEDHPEILELFQMLLGEASYEVIVANYCHREQILDFIKQIQPDLIITDLMTGMKTFGLHIVRQLQSELATMSIPVIVCTAALMQLKEAQVELEANHAIIITKPFDIDNLLETVEKLTKVVIAT